MSDLPKGWVETSLGEVAKYINGRAFKPTEWKDSGLPIIRIQNLNDTSARFNYTDKTHQEKFKVKKDDLLIAWSASLGAFIWQGNDAWLNQHIFRVEPFYDLVTKKFLYFAVTKAIEELYKKAHGTGMVHVTKPVFESHSIPLPPLNEQKRIVAKLEALLSRVDASKERLEKIPKILKRFRQSVLAAACSGKLTADWRAENSNIKSASDLLQEIKEIRLQNATSNKEKSQIIEAFSTTEILDEFDLPLTWVSCSVGHIGTVTNGSTPSRKVPEYWDGNIHWVSSGEVRNNIIFETRESITQTGYENSSVKLLPKGTVLLAMIGEGKTRGQTAILEIDATINQNSAAIVISHGLVDSKYLWHWFRFQYETTREQGSGSGPQALNCQRVRELPFILPPLPEQKEIVRRVENLFKFADSIEERFKQAKAQVDKLTNSILAKAFRGELVPQDETEEPASVLLERIKAEKETNQGKTPTKRKAVSQGKLFD